MFFDLISSSQFIKYLVQSFSGGTIIKMCRGLVYMKKTFCGLEQMKTMIRVLKRMQIMFQGLDRMKIKAVTHNPLFEKEEYGQLQGNCRENGKAFR